MFKIRAFKFRDLDAVFEMLERLNLASLDNEQAPPLLSIPQAS